MSTIKATLETDRAGMFLLAETALSANDKVLVTNIGSQAIAADVRTAKSGRCYAKFYSVTEASWIEIRTA